MIAALAVSILAFQGPAGWDGFAPGSWAEHTTTGKREGAPVRTIERTSLKDVTPSDVVISLDTVDAAGGRSLVDMKYPLPQREVPKEDEGRKTGEETLAIDGKSFACEILERRGVRRWICRTAAANKGVLKTESITGSVQLLTRVLKLGEKVAVGKETLTCWVREDITDTGDQKTTRTTWMSDAVPGGVVRSEVRQVRGKETAEETVTILTAFEVVKKK